VKSRVVALLAFSALTPIAIGQIGPSAASPPDPPPAGARPEAPTERPPTMLDRIRKDLLRRGASEELTFPVVRLRSTVGLRLRPGRRVAARLNPRTEFGSPRVFHVAAERGRWLGVVTTARPNGKLAWIRRSKRRLRYGRVRHSLHADLSRRRLVLMRRDKVIWRMRVAIGRPGSPTPRGRFAITDKLSGSRFGPYYGCCILALSGTQPNLPPGWRGGNRLAIHGTNSPWSIGKRSSAGCLRAADRDLRFLMRRVRLGTPVFIRR
jgi:hypothetical protein